MIRVVSNEDAALAEIYNHYINTTTITFEEIPIRATEMQQRILKITNAGLPWLVAEENNQLVGWAYASPWRERSAYRFSVESTVYLSPTAIRKGWGTRLYCALITELKKTEVHTMIGGIALPNPASVALHEKMDMVKVAHFKSVGYKFDQWIDVAYWQLEFDNHSSTKQLR